MTPEQQRIVIAEVCGWKRHVVPLHDADGLITELKTMIRWVALNEVLNVNPYWNRSKCPDYLNDLNAMHEAENIQRKEDPFWWKGYSAALYHAYGVSATAAQRAEAFLRTLNLWTT